MENIKVYDQLMTPEWIKSHAEITGRHNVTQSYFEILPTTGNDYQRALRVPLIPPGLLASNDSVTVVIIAAFDTTIVQTNDHDPNFGISDGKTFFGFEVPDPANYMNFPPCFSVSADVVTQQVCNFYLRIQMCSDNIFPQQLSTPSITDVKLGKGPFTNSTRYPSIVTTRIKPSEKWGSCETPQEDGGYNNLAFYQSTLDLSNGLYFELYYNNADEEYHIEYIQVDVVLNL